MSWGFSQNDQKQVSGCKRTILVDLWKSSWQLGSAAIINANDVRWHLNKNANPCIKSSEKKRGKENHNVVPREVLRPWGRISVHVRDKSLLQGIFWASLKEIELPDLGEEEEKKTGYIAWNMGFWVTRCRCAPRR